MTLYPFAATPPDVLPYPARRLWLIFSTISLLVTVIVAVVGWEYGRTAAIETLSLEARTEANLKVALLRAVLERPRALPLVLSQDRDVIDALARPGPQTADLLNDKLESLVKETQAAVIYVTRADGLTIASSNWREPASFVGNDYSFRDYFRRARDHGVGEHFALGNVSNRPGLYISRRVEVGRVFLGVVVVKMEFDGLEANWRDTGRPTYVTDHDGVVLITSRPDWRFMVTAPLPVERLKAIQDSREFGGAALFALPFTAPVGLGAGVTAIEIRQPGQRAEAFLHLGLAVPTTAWTLDYLLPLEPALTTAARTTSLLAVAAVAPLIALAAVVLRRRQSAALRLTLTQQARIELEKRVHERTEDLSRARDLLQAEIAGHRETEAQLRGVQQELVAANRLAILGQVAAGVAHEINQPVATIRAYADNAAIYLDRGRTPEALDNLTAIAGLTERIGTITAELKAFARKGRAAPEAVELRAAVEGAVVLLRSRFAGRMEALDIALPPLPIAVRANRIRLEQVLINLIQNGLEALDDGRDGRIKIRAAAEGARVILTVADNGPGIPEAIRRALFTPFNTSKERGLGLGLVIAKEILVDYGGEIAVETGATGTTFTIHLPKA